ncbi:MAG: AmmeMemoRadiSam system protein A [Verrucomicrobia bacterium]|jgi:AmmeMemoRadiSam system protein A/AmmeMemoRadiSam system protein B|nr:AmmeMemoRadiSam system protein A [Verrucomicrobiota bacterium]
MKHFSKPAIDLKASTAVDAPARFTVCAVLMPHAPILVPAVGGKRGDAAAATCRAMRDAANCVLGCRPEALVLISPHSPRKRGAFGLWSGDRLEGSFEQFAAPQVAVSFPNDRRLADAIISGAQGRSLQTWAIRDRSLDHGALVPLWFLADAGWSGPIVILSLGYPAEGGLSDLGEAIAAAANSLQRRVAVIASGDMSHRLTANAPCGYHPRAHHFDQTFIRLLGNGEYRGLENIDPQLRECAAEDAVDSTLIAAAAVGWKADGHQVLNYEGPFGVGYGVAILFAKNPGSSDAETTPSTAAPPDGAVLPTLARQSVEAALRASSELPPPPTGDYLAARRGVFVTVCRRDGKLRGCVGTIVPVGADLMAETWRNARLAAFQDSRFPPVTAEELADLRFQVSVLHFLEAITSATELDPQRYGVIVSTGDGRRGLLLPGIQGIKTSEEQLLVARRKGGIDLDEPVALQRFQVDHFEEAV